MTTSDITIGNSKHKELCREKFLLQNTSFLYKRNTKCIKDNQYRKKIAEVARTHANSEMHLL